MTERVNVMKRFTSAVLEIYVAIHPFHNVFFRRRFKTLVENFIHLQRHMNERCICQIFLPPFVILNQWSFSISLWQWSIQQCLTFGIILSQEFSAFYSIVRQGYTFFFYTFASLVHIPAGIFLWYYVPPQYLTSGITLSEQLWGFYNDMWLRQMQISNNFHFYIIFRVSV